MRVVVQRVSRASVQVAGEPVSEIGRGLLCLVGVAGGDGEEDARWMARKIAVLRVFSDAAGKLNRSVSEVGGAVLAVSQFTLLGDARKGTRPSFAHAAPAEQGRRLYERLCRLLEERGLSVGRGRFGAHMEVEMVGEGPVTILLDSRKG